MKYGHTFQVVTEESVQLTDMPEATQLDGAEALKNKKWDAFMTLRDGRIKSVRSSS